MATSKKQAPKKAAANKTTKKLPPKINNKVSRPGRGLNKKNHLVKDEVSKNEDYLVKFTFSEAEINAKAKKMADHNDKINTLLGELESLKEQYKSKINSEKAAFNELMGHVGNGYEFRKMQCVVKMNDPEIGKKSYYLDGVLVENGIESMLSHDFQTVIKFNEAKVEDSDFSFMYDLGNAMWEINNFEKLKEVFKVVQDPNNIKTVDDFLDKSKRHSSELRFGTSDIYTGQTLRQHLTETKNLELFLQKLEN